jgi:hypothetical protein
MARLGGSPRPQPAENYPRRLRLGKTLARHPRGCQWDAARGITRFPFPAPGLSSLPIGSPGRWCCGSGCSPPPAPDRNPMRLSAPPPRPAPGSESAGGPEGALLPESRRALQHPPDPQPSPQPECRRGLRPRTRHPRRRDRGTGRAGTARDAVPAASMPWLSIPLAAACACANAASLRSERLFINHGCSAGPEPRKKSPAGQSGGA